MLPEIEIFGRKFCSFLSPATIQTRITALGNQITDDYADKNPIFLGILNGAFVFAADLARACEGLDSEWAFVRLSSYSGMDSSGELNTKLGLDTGLLRGRHVIIVEDIVDTGNTLHRFMADIWSQKPMSVALAAAFVKREAMQHEVKIDYVGFDIPNVFVIGYGLDFDGKGRNLSSLYRLK
jgi:hypoxanthine phosphoribosyltransferase